jgi:predicted nucleic acid-binding protein
VGHTMAMHSRDARHRHHPRIFDPPTPLEIACDQVESWLESPSLVLLAEPGGLYWKELRASVLDGGIQGPQVHDARIAALCLVHGVSELWSADRHFGRFPRLRVQVPVKVGLRAGQGRQGVAEVRRRLRE